MSDLVDIGLGLFTGIAIAAVLITACILSCCGIGFRAGWQDDAVRAEQ